MTLHKDHERALYSLQSAAKYLIFKGCPWSFSYVKCSASIHFRATCGKIRVKKTSPLMIQTA